MPRIIHTNLSEFKHKYAFNEFGDVIPLESASKIINGNKIKYYLLPNCQGEMILKDGEIKAKHFAIKSDSKIIINGREFDYSQSSESVEHIDFKLKIKNDKYFNWANYEIPIESIKIESRITGSKFRCDLSAQLNDGDNINIEVVKTSDVSDSKMEYLRKHNSLTFIIYIDEYGNQINGKFNIIGNEEIERIEKEITRIESIISVSDSEKRRAWRNFYEEQRRNESEINAIKEQISRLEKQHGFDGEIGISTEDELIEKICETLFNAKEIRKRVGENKRIFEDIRTIENSFNEVARDCKKEWFGPKWMHPERGTELVSWIKYFTT